MTRSGRELGYYIALAAAASIVGVWTEAGFPAMSNLAGSLAKSRPLLATAVALFVLGSVGTSSCAASLLIHRVKIPWFSDAQATSFQRALNSFSLLQLSGWIALALHVIFWSR